MARRCSLLSSKRDQSFTSPGKVTKVAGKFERVEGDLSNRWNRSARRALATYPRLESQISDNCRAQWTREPDAGAYADLVRRSVMFADRSFGHGRLMCYEAKVVLKLAVMAKVLDLSKGDFQPRERVIDLVCIGLTAYATDPSVLFEQGLSSVGQLICDQRAPPHTHRRPQTAGVGGRGNTEEISQKSPLQGLFLTVGAQDPQRDYRS
ncbi:hypothetical protein GQ44DRAFT_721310 [Phaeosphaeriaceae sp. PMI808]|nr:hypothetical protein GQ44DRAFT_721310 [Phaeosphaeriaceae sp. PMI808]